MDSCRRRSSSPTSIASSSVACRSVISSDFLAHEGGHIGYVVLAQHRRQGYATEMLRTSLQITSDLGITRVLVTCDDDNLVSARVIERCGGVLENVVEGRSGVAKRRYWIAPPGPIVIVARIGSRMPKVMGHRTRK